MIVTESDSFLNIKPVEKMTSLVDFPDNYRD